MRDAAIGAHGALGKVVLALDAVSRRWLRRSRCDPHAGEVLAVAERMGGGGVCALNLIYDWACTTAVTVADGCPRMLRVLDWGLPGIAAHSVAVARDGVAGRWLAITWPGLVSVFTGLAPGRFAAAINQPPNSDPLRRLALIAGGDGVPAGHLLRQVFDAAADFESAVAMLAAPGLRLLSPALFTLAGTRPGEGCVIEARGMRRRLHRAATHPGGVLAVANAWLSDWPGRPRAYAAGRGEGARANNARRCVQLAAVARDAAWQEAALAAPTLNPKTVHVLALSPATGDVAARALDRGSIVLGPTRINAGAG